jgi:hypothetical protein
MTCPCIKRLSRVRNVRRRGPDIGRDAQEDNSGNRVLGAGDDRDLGLIRFHNALLVYVRRLSRTTHFLGSR